MSGKFDMMSLIKKAKEKDAQLTASKTGKSKKNKKRKLSESSGVENVEGSGTAEQVSESIECKNLLLGYS